MTASNPVLRRAAVMLERAGKEKKARIWAEASRALAAETSNRVEVNVGRLSRIAEDDQAVFVPGKVLGSGTVDRKLVVGAFSFSSSARGKIESSGGSALGVAEFLAKFPDGSGVKLVE